MADQVFFTITPFAPATNAIITAIRVQDIARGIWYSWDRTTQVPNGSWNNAGGGGVNAPVDQAPQVTPGTGDLYIAANAINMGQPGNLTVTIADSAGNVLQSTSTSGVATGGNASVVWTGTMPNGNYNIVITGSP